MTRLRQDALRGPGSAELAAKVRRGADALDAWPRPSGTSQPKIWIAIT